MSVPGCPSVCPMPGSLPPLSASPPAPWHCQQPLPSCLSLLQYIEAISNKQGELENYVSDGYKTALTEERRRFCFLVEKQCAVAKSAITYHAKGKEMLTQKLPLWQQSCSDPNKIPERAIQLMQQMAASSNGTIMPSPLSTSKSNLIISDPIPGAKPLPVPPELAPFVGVSIPVLELPCPLSKGGGTSPGRCHRCPRQVVLGWAGTGGRDGSSGPSWGVGRSLTWHGQPVPPHPTELCRAGIPGAFGEPRSWTCLSRLVPELWD
nr:uncharacterized protein LOC102067576 [Zonotrichia albicollis]